MKKEIEDFRQRYFLWGSLFFCVLALLFFWFWTSPIQANAVDYAGSSSNSMVVSNSKITLYQDSSLKDLYRAYGSERLKTKSKYGGYAYSFYDDNYANYLYIETSSDDQLIFFATFGDDFRSYLGNAGERPSYGYDSNGGVYSNNSTGTIWAVDGFWGAFSDERKQELNAFAVQNYDQDAVYAEGIAHHAALMWNAISLYFGRPANAVFSSRAFYMNRQLMENKSDFKQYCEAIGSNAFQMVDTYGPLPDIKSRNCLNPNPLYYANLASYRTIPAESYVIFDEAYYSDTRGDSILIQGSISQSLIDESNRLPYTPEEQELIARMRQKYADSMKSWNDVVDARNSFIEQPQFSNLPLNQGKLHPDLAKAAVELVNVIRIGAGLGELEYSEELSDDAMCKAVLLAYLETNKISYTDPHDPPKPKGLDDEFYAKSKSGMGENLYGGDFDSIIDALEDSYSAPTCGHRSNLLNPNYTSMGYGYFHGDSVHKFDFDPFQEPQNTPEVIAWPSKGIMIAEARASGDTVYTIDFRNNLTPTEDSTVIFKCLNTGREVITDSDSDHNTSNLYTSDCYIAYQNDAISIHAGNIYEITVTNLRDKNTGDIKDYTYRSICEKMSENTGSGSGTETLQLSANQLALESGERAKLSAKILPENAANKMVKWTSDNDSIATVNENGMITTHQVGNAVITAVTDNGFSESCVVTVIAAKPIKIESCTWNSQASASIVTFKLAPDFQLSPRNIRIYAAAYDQNQTGKMTRVYTGVLNGAGDSATFQGKIGNNSGTGSETWKIFLTDLDGKPICKAMTLGF